MAEKDRKRSIDGGDHDEADDGERATKSQKAIRLLREVTTLLTESVNEGEAKESREEPKRVGASSSAILNDFRNIFSPYRISPVALTSTFQHWGQIVSEIVAQLYSENSIQTLLIFFGLTQKQFRRVCIEFCKHNWATISEAICPQILIFGK